MADITEIFTDTDDFCQSFESAWKKTLLESGVRQRIKASSLCLSEVMAILIFFHQSNHRNFKNYYIGLVCGYMHDAFPGLVSYNRFVELMRDAALPLLVFMWTTRRGQATGIAFVDSTPLKACHIKRERSHRTFKEEAAKSKTSTGWFYGFKLHLIINDKGELLAFHVTPGNTDDRVPVEQMAEGLFGKLFGDKGYISQKLFERLLEKGVQLVTKIRKNMKNKLMPFVDKVLLRKRAIIETVNDQLKNISQIEHTRHRSITGFICNLLAGLIAYTYREKLPSLNIKIGIPENSLIVA